MNIRKKYLTALLSLALLVSPATQCIEPISIGIAALAAGSAIGIGGKTLYDKHAHNKENKEAHKLLKKIHKKYLEELEALREKKLSKSLQESLIVERHGDQAHRYLAYNNEIKHDLEKLKAQEEHVSNSDWALFETTLVGLSRIKRVTNTSFGSYIIKEKEQSEKNEAEREKKEIEQKEKNLSLKAKEAELTNQQSLGKEIEHLQRATSSLQTAGKEMHAEVGSLSLALHRFNHKTEKDKDEIIRRLLSIEQSQGITHSKLENLSAQARLQNEKEEMRFSLIKNLLSDIKTKLQTLIVTDRPSTTAQTPAFSAPGSMPAAPGQAPKFSGK